MRVVGVIALAIGMAATTASAQNGGTPEASSKILALENAWNWAEWHGDSKALDGILDNALIYIDFEGESLTKAEFLARVKERNGKVSQLANEGMTVRLFGNTAVVNGIYREKGVEQGKPYLRRGRFLDTWVHKDKGWLCVASQNTPLER